MAPFKEARLTVGRLAAPLNGLSIEYRRQTTGVDLTVLITERLTLAPVQASDFADLCALFGDLAFTRHVIGRALSPEEVWFRTLRDVGHWETLRHGNWAARLKDGDDLVGTLGVLDYKREMTPAFDSPELGWGIAPHHQRKGMGMEALSAALAWCDDVLAAPRTVCMISPDNAASIALAARAGYTAYAETTYHDGPVVLLERAARQPSHRVLTG